MRAGGGKTGFEDMLSQFVGILAERRERGLPFRRRRD